MAGLHVIDGNMWCIGMIRASGKYCCGQGQWQVYWCEQVSRKCISVNSGVASVLA